MKIDSLEKKLLAENSQTNSILQYSLYAEPPKEITNDSYSFALGRNSGVVAFANWVENKIVYNPEEMWYQNKNQVRNHETRHINQNHYSRTTYDLESEADVISGTRIDQAPNYSGSLSPYN